MLHTLINIYKTNSDLPAVHNIVKPLFDRMDEMYNLEVLNVGISWFWFIVQPLHINHFPDFPQV